MLDLLPSCVFLGNRILESLQDRRVQNCNSCNSVAVPLKPIPYTGLFTFSWVMKTAAFSVYHWFFSENSSARTDYFQNKTSTLRTSLALSYPYNSTCIPEEVRPRTCVQPYSRVLVVELSQVTYNKHGKGTLYSAFSHWARDCLVVERSRRDQVI
ncbi:hypothetical protein AKJ16_DCAP01144 [Drosera capensis]